MIDTILDFIKVNFGIVITSQQSQDIFLLFLAVCLIWMFCAFISGKAPTEDWFTQLVLAVMFCGAAYALYKIFPRLYDVFVDTLFIGCIAFATHFFRLFCKRFGEWIEFLNRSKMF